MSNSSPRPIRRSRRVPHAYWFRPKRFWNHFAAFYPVRWEGWVILAAITLLILQVVDSVADRSISAATALLLAAPPILVLMLIFDLITLQTGEYPRWWLRSHGPR
jgi:hypothetical protein